MENQKRLNYLTGQQKFLMDPKFILVPRKKQSLLALTDYVTNLTSIYSDLLQAYLILATLATSNN